VIGPEGHRRKEEEEQSERLREAATVERFMNLRRRLLRLERQKGLNGNITAVAFDVPGASDLQFQAGQWVPCPDRGALLASLKDLPVKVYSGFDPREV